LVEKTTETRTMRINTNQREERAMNQQTIKAILISLALVLGMLGCDTQGPAEKVGEKIDQSVESAKDAVDEAGDQIAGKGPAEQIGEEVDEAVESVKETVENN
jgi:ElaB/YqjD/DUF883 family membrane-anchored ribosome-binding protein